MYKAFTGLGMLGAALLGKNKGINPNSRYLKEMLASYLKTALWSSTGDDEEPLDKNYTVTDVAPETLRQARKDVEKFIENAGGLLDNISADSAGHDFWLTRNGHGAGFWDGDYPENIGDALTKVSHGFREIDPYVGDDGKIYFG
jgi:hypothetical protein